jgi:hypothetical protein
VTTVATVAVRGFAQKWETLYSSAKCSGICGNAAHQAKGGYHIGRAFQPSSNYSVVRKQDQYGPADAAAAVDMTMNEADMKLCTKRLAVAYANTADPRRKYLNGFNGWDGSGDATRYDFITRRTSRASDDHRWHVHLEYRRMYVTSAAAMQAVLSILAGESVPVYLRSAGVKISPSKASTTGATAKAPSYPGRPLRRTDSPHFDPEVKRWQARMVNRGWTRLGKVDGQFGPKTEDVVRRFQASCKVAVDGSVGRITWALPWTRPIGR